MDLTRGLYFSVCVNNNYDFNKRKQVLLPPETTLKGPIYYRMVNLTVLFNLGSQANKLAPSANKMSSASFDALFISLVYTTRKTGAQDGSLGGPFVERSSDR